SLGNSALHRPAGPSDGVQDRHVEDPRAADPRTGGARRRIRHSRLPRHGARRRRAAARDTRAARGRLGRGVEALAGVAQLELPLELEAVEIAIDRRERHRLATRDETHGRVVLIEAAVDLDPVPLRRVADVVDADVVLRGPEERHGSELLALAEHVARGRLPLPLRDDPVLDANALTRV